MRVFKEHIMSETKLIMPKQTGQIDAFLTSLKLYFESFIRGEKWYSNNEFKHRIQEELPYLADGAQDEAYLVKQSELTRYFGLVHYDYSCRPGKAHITNSGIDFYNAYLSQDIDTQRRIIMDAILNNSFGRNNTAIKSSDSDIDPPKLFLKAIQDLQGINKKGFGYLLYMTHNLDINYNDAVIELSKSYDIDREIPISVANKYNDVKFTILLNSLGITKIDNDEIYQLSDFTINNYYNQLKDLSIYNKEPDILFTLKEEVEDANIDNTSDIDYQKEILTSLAYNTNSDRFKSQNNRTPIPYTSGSTRKYKTNARIAKTAIDIQNYKCLYNIEHKTFTSKLGKQYMEAHHLIPMAAQKDFNINIDRIENIVSICPVCHSAIHFGDKETRFELLRKLYNEKENELKSVGINTTFEELFIKYYK